MTAGEPPPARGQLRQREARQIATRAATGRTRTDPQAEAAGSRGGRDRRQARSAAPAEPKERERGPAQGRSGRARAKGSRIRAAGPCKHRGARNQGRGSNGETRERRHAPGKTADQEKPRQDRPRANPQDQEARQLSGPGPHHQPIQDQPSARRRPAAPRRSQGRKSQKASQLQQSRRPTGQSDCQP